MIEVFNAVLLGPMLNILMVFAKFMAGNFGLAIIAVTILVRILILPLSLKQLRATKAMQQMQPKLKELQKKYSKDRQRFAQEQMKLYKEHGVSPLGCTLPMIIQFPIWIALYQTIIQALAVTPEGLVGLSQQLYSWSAVQGVVPLNSGFLWFDLAKPDIPMAILVAASMWALQKMSTMPAMDPKQESMNRLMTLMMPLMFGYFALSFPSGLSLYWVLFNLLSIGMQYKVTGWGSLSMPFKRTQPSPATGKGEPVIPAEEEESQPAPGGSEAEKRVKRRLITDQAGTRDGKHRSKRKDRGRGRSNRPR